MLASDPAIEHAYQALFDNFYLRRNDGPLKTLLVTSSQPEEGKTTVALMLALTAAKAGKRVLLIDADLRKPKVHRLLGLDTGHSLADVLAGSADIQDAVQMVEIEPVGTGAAPAALAVMAGASAGAASSASTLATPALKALLDDLAARFDFVFIDSPPVLAVTDPLFVAPAVDGVLLVVAAGTSEEEDTKQARQRIEQAGGRIIGIVMNRFDEKLHGTGLHPYYESYRARARR